MVSETTKPKRSRSSHAKEDARLVNVLADAAMEYLKLVVSESAAEAAFFASPNSTELHRAWGDCIPFTAAAAQSLLSASRALYDHRNGAR